MKKKLFIGGAALLFAAVTAFNMNMLQGNSVGDVSLDAIAVMAQAQDGEHTIGGDDCDNCQYYIADVACFRIFYSPENGGKKSVVYIGNRLKCEYGGKGGCISTNCQK